MKAYQMLLGDSQIFKAYGVTIFTTVVGTLFSMFLTITMAYLLSLKKVRFRNVITFFVYFTMLFGGGLVSTYLLVSKTLNMQDSDILGGRNMAAYLFAHFIGEKKRHGGAGRLQTENMKGCCRGLVRRVLQYT